MNDVVEYHIAQGWVPDNFVPASAGKLAGDQQRSLGVAIIDDLEQVAPLFGGQGLGSPIDDQQAGAFEGGHQPREPALRHACRGDIGNQARGAPVQDGDAFTA